VDSLEKVIEKLARLQQQLRQLRDIRRIRRASSLLSNFAAWRSEIIFADASVKAAAELCC
jgi:hypothetical protein